MQQETEEEKDEIDDVEVDRVQRFAGLHKVADQIRAADENNQPVEDRGVFEPLARSGIHDWHRRFDLRFSENDAKIARRFAAPSGRRDQPHHDGNERDLDDDRREALPEKNGVASSRPVMMMSAICSVNRMNSHKPLPQASITCGRPDGVSATPATITIRVARSAKTKASGTHRSVQSVNASAMRARIPASVGGFVLFAERGSRRCIASQRLSATSNSAPVLARTSSTVTPGCSSVRTSPPPCFTSNTQRSVMMRLTTPKAVMGSVHCFKIFGLPSLELCSITATTRFTPATRSIAPPGPLIILPGIIQFAISPLSVTSNAPRLARSMCPPRIMVNESALEK